MSKEWEWFGHAGHFICSRECQFHLCTLVGGKWLVSTVGELFPDAPVREIKAKSRGITLEGKGDARVSDYMQKIGFDDIGSGRKYETMVFLAGDRCAQEDCGCGLPGISGSELDGDGYNDPGSAKEGHMRLCKKWSEKE